MDELLNRLINKENRQRNNWKLVYCKPSRESPFLFQEHLVHEFECHKIDFLHFMITVTLMVNDIVALLSCFALYTLHQSLDFTLYQVLVAKNKRQRMKIKQLISGDFDEWERSISKRGQIKFWYKQYWSKIKIMSLTYKKPSLLLGCTSIGRYFYTLWGMLSKHDVYVYNSV